MSTTATDESSALAEVYTFLRVIGRRANENEPPAATEDSKGEVIAGEQIASGKAA